MLPTSDRDGDVSFHGRRGLDGAAARTRGRGLRGGACRASARDAGGVRRPTAGSRWTPRAMPSSSPSRPRPARSRPRQRMRSWLWADPGADGPAHRYAGARRGGLRRRRRAPRCAHRRVRATAGRCSSRLRRHRLRAGGLARSRRAPAEGSDRARAHLPARRRRVSAAQERSSGRTCRFLRRRSSGANESWTRWAVSCGDSSAHADRPRRHGKDPARASAAADASDRYPDGVWWVPLLPCATPRSCSRRRAGRRGEGRPCREHRRQARCSCSRQLRAVSRPPPSSRALAACPNLHLLVTSREPLHVARRAGISVPPLAPAGRRRLFVARARAVDAGLRDDEACRDLRRLDNLPLALELAAARVQVLSPGSCSIASRSV